MKNILRHLARRLGYEVLPRTDEPVLAALLKTYRELRLTPRDTLLWDHQLSQLASLGHLRSLLRHHAIDLVLDVGANRGQFGLNARRAGYAGEIISFEPIASRQAELHRLASDDGRWRIVRCGVGATPGKLELNVYRDDTFSSVLPVNNAARRNFGDLVALDHTEQIDIHPLDDLCERMSVSPKRRVFLKTDTQGYDAAVLAGADRILAQTSAVVTEMTYAPLYQGASGVDQVEERLLARGFQRAGIFPISYTPAQRSLIEVDCYFTRTQSTANTIK